ncbi:MAG TPA: hypothetical protein DHV28_13985 [Ignavibacteriales bacterium]|nr:hypothetical protein [Ignavibacteriales bacterium]
MKFLKLNKLKLKSPDICSNVYFIAILFFLSPFSLSQTRVDSLEYLGRFMNANFFNSRFDKQLNTFHLTSQLQLFNDFDDVIIGLNENFSSTFIRNETKNTRDEQHFNLNSKYFFNKTISVGLSGSSSLLSDNRSLGINESAVNYATMYSELNPVNNIKVNPFIGYSSNRQIGVTDNGSVYGIEGTLNRLNLSNMEINSDLRFRNDDIIPRRNLIRYYFLSVKNNFDRSVANNIQTVFSQNRKDFYFEADSITSSQFKINKNIQSRIETAYQIYDRLSYDQFLEIFSLDLAAGINWRKIERENRYKSADLLTNALYDSRIDELKLEIDAATRYSSKLFDGTIRFNFYERDEKHLAIRFDGMQESIFEQKNELEEQKNNNSSRATVSVSGNFKLSFTDLLTFSLYQSKLIFDTQSKMNDDDRDELLSIVRLRYLKVLSPYFSGFINAEGTFGHTVYLFASRSSNNNQNKIIRLRIGGDYYGSILKSYNSFEVSANYTVYDFEDIATNNQSYAFRQFTAVDSTTLNLTNDVSLFTYGYLKLSEIGDFKWDNFTSRPTRFLEELYLEPRFIFAYNRSIFSVGLRLFLLSTYSYQKNQKTPDSDYLSIGPIALVDLLAWKNLNILLKGYYEFISNTNLPDKQQASLLIQINWKF